MIRLLALLAIAFSAPAAATEFVPDSPESEYLPAAPGEPPIDFCSKWNPEFGFRGTQCCTKPGPVVHQRRGRRRTRRASACAPDRIKWTFCDEMTPEQKRYVEGVKAGTIDPLETVMKGMGSKGGQAFCGVSNGFLVNGLPLIPTSSNRIELRNEARCANFGTDGLVGALEWTGREIKKEYFEPEFRQARMIIGDLSAPRGGCMAGRGGRRAHKSHTSGVDVDMAFFNPRAGGSPEERFTRSFYVATNWWFLKKLFKNPVSCVKVVFLDRNNIARLGKYAKDDPEWPKLRSFIRHVRGHRDHFHIRFGSGPGPAGCASDPELEEDEDMQDEIAEEGSILVKSEEAPDEMGVDLAEHSMDEEAEFEDGPTSEDPDRHVASAVAGAAPSGDPASLAASAVSSVQTGLASGPVMASTTLPPHKLEPAITSKMFARAPRKKHKRVKVRPRATAKN